ncbi:pantoate--beta-alanine ligase [Mechercharimyces sp. CAU 1602]|uniref:pantoate--beta-alanine ligase n=1 Tax=Mechercharimyces sp. CAU 1602 TaxID=2973933 RepID=UPI002161D9FD|nr:pantoate--beta-alanine ligase [Mechercharimyces sp. CAU 1602]MCS1351015.1 pantoate--beta-alanine ligase [Mechercharimyces sp. CAU 1602]
MHVITDIEAMRHYRQGQEGKKIGFVPTMGALHAGHLSLIEQARTECEAVIISIFVNPLQFGPNEDFEKYPRELKRDIALAEGAGADVVFAPTQTEMYPRPLVTQVVVAEITERLCGASRPGHFTGVTTVVSKLFHIVQPTHAYFGLKDAQQVAVIERMVEDLHFPLEIVPCPTVREEDGLALSSRNRYLSKQEREQAPILYQALTRAEANLLQGKYKSSAHLEEDVRTHITSQPLAQIEYVEALTYPDLTPLTDLHSPLILLLAVRFGDTRLIDNILLNKGEQ